VRRLALALPETSEGLSRELRQWRVKDKGFVWERPLLADDPAVFFTTPHFDGYAAVLVRLDRIGVEDLSEVIVEAWLARAPKRLAKAYLDA
jgi:hypothetical protein